MSWKKSHDEKFSKKPIDMQSGIFIVLIYKSLTMILNANLPN